MSEQAAQEQSGHIVRGRVHVETTDGITRITIDDPARLGAVDAAMLTTIADSVVEASADPQVRVIVLTGTGRGFCSGANLTLGDGQEIDDATLFEAGRAVRAMTESPKAVVSLVNGVAAGVGVSLALGADYVLAKDTASFVLAFSKIALMPDGGATALVAASIGRARAMRLALTAEKFSAVDAAAAGLVAEVVSAEDFDARGQEVIALLASRAPRATELTKAAINAATLDLPAAIGREESGQSELLRSQDFREGAAAFAERRPAIFRGH